VAGTVGSGATAVCLATLAKVLGLTSKCTLVDLTILSSGEWATVVLKLDDRGGGLSCHVVNCVLVTEPVGALDSVVHVPSPVVLVHVAKSSVDATLSSNCVRSCRKQLGNDSRLETSLSETKAGS